MTTDIKAIQEAKRRGCANCIFFFLHDRRACGEDGSCRLLPQPLTVSFTWFCGHFTEVSCEADDAQRKLEMEKKSTYGYRNNGTWTAMKVG
jgi:hypothetical protein